MESKGNVARITVGLDLPKRVQKELKKRRKDLLTLAYESGVSYWTLEKIAGGAIRNPSFEKLIRIASVLFPEMAEGQEDKASLRQGLRAAKAALDTIMAETQDEAMRRVAESALARISSTE